VSLNRPFFIQNLLRYNAEKILPVNTTNFRGDYHPIDQNLPDCCSISGIQQILFGKWIQYFVQTELIGE